jgi:hypothetical protein
MLSALAVLGVGIPFAGHFESKVGVLAGGALVLGAVALVFAAWWWSFVLSGRNLIERAEGLDLLEAVSGPFRTVSLVRGSCDGRAVRVYRDRVEVEVAAPRTSSVDSTVLAGLARASDANAAVQAAAATLEAAGVRAVEMWPNVVVIRGGTGPAVELARAAVEVALASAKIRFSGASARGAASCPFCHEAVGSVAHSPSLRCGDCDTLHHAECWREHGGCAIFSCRRAPKSRAASPEAAPPKEEPSVAPQRGRA